MNRITLALCFVAALLGKPAFTGADHVDAYLSAVGAGLVDWNPVGDGVVVLSHREQITLHLDAHERLRLGLIDSAHPDDLSVKISEGNGFWQAVSPIASGNALQIPAYDTPRLVRVAHARREGELRLSVSSGRVAFDDRGIAYERPVDLNLPQRLISWRDTPGRPVRLLYGPARHLDSTRGYTHVERGYGQISQDQVVQFLVKGRARLRVEARLLPENVASFYRSFRIDWTLDGADMPPMEFEAGWSLRRNYRFEDGSPVALSEATTGYLDIPTGGEITLRPSRALLMRVDGLGGALASPSANAASGVERALDATIARGTSALPDLTWGALSTSAPKLIDPYALTPESIVSQARRFARTNTFADTALVAADLVTARAERAQSRDLESAAERFTGVYSTYAALEPINRRALDRVLLWDTLPRLLGPAEAQPDGNGIGIPTRALLGQIVTAPFYPLKPGAALDFVLPESTAIPRLRILVDGATAKGARIKLEADGQETVYFALEPERTAPDEMLRSDDLSTLAQRAGGWRNLYAGLADDALRGAARTDMRHGTLTLPRGASRIRLTAVSATSPLRVAVEARRSIVTRLDAPTFLSEVDRLWAGEGHRLVRNALRAAIDCRAWLRSPGDCRIDSGLRGGHLPAQEIYNDLVPLFRLLRARETLVFDTVRDTISPLTAGASHFAADGNSVETLIKEAERWRRDGQPILAIETLAEAQALADADQQARIFGAQIELLGSVGEPFLAERIARRIALDCASGAAGQRATQWLRQRYAEGADTARLIGVETRALVCGRNGPERLLDLLRQDGQYGDALKMAILFGHSAAEAELLKEETARAWPFAVDASTATEEVWKEAEVLVNRNAGTVPIGVPARGLRFVAHRATPTAPIAMRVDRDAVLQLRIRPLHKSSLSLLSGHVMVQTGHRNVVHPIIENRPSSTLVNESGSGVIGTAEIVHVNVHAGEQVVLRPHNVDIAVEMALAPPGTEVPRNSLAVDELAETTLAEQLAVFERDPMANAALLVSAAETVAPELRSVRPSSDDALRLWRRFERLTEWARVDAFSASAGITSVARSPLAVESPRLRVRIALAQGLDRGARLVPSRNALVLRCRTASHSIVTAQLALFPLPASDAQEARIEIISDIGAPTVVTLSSTNRRRVIVLPCEDSSNSVRIRLKAPVTNALVTLNIDANHLAQRDVAPERIYEVATRNEPVIYAPADEEFVRVDELRNGRTLSRFLILRPEQQPLQLRPPDGTDRALFRVFRLQPVVSEDADLETDAPIAPQRTSQVPGPSVAVTRLPSHFGLAGAGDVLLPVADTFASVPPGRPGTWSVGSSFRLRNTAADGAVRDVRALEFSAQYRRHWTNSDVFSLTEALVRSGPVGPRILGMRQRLEWPDRFNGWNFETEAKIFTEMRDDRLWRASLDVEASRRITLSETADFRFGAGLYTSQTSHSALPAGTSIDSVDPDVFNSDAVAHDFGATMNARLTWRPYEDLHFYADAALRTNENLDVVSPDRLSLKLGYRHILGGLRYDFSTQHRKFYADRDRSADTDFTSLGLDASWEAFSAKDARFEMFGSVNYRLEDDRVDVTLGITWHFGSGFEDTPPDSLAFRDLREKRRIEHYAKPINRD